MSVIYLYTGLILICLGFFIQSIPSFILGPRAMSREQEVEIDQEGLSMLIKKGFAFLGIATIYLYLLDNWLMITWIPNSIVIFLIIVGSIVLFVKSRQFLQPG